MTRAVGDHTSLPPLSAAQKRGMLITGMSSSSRRAPRSGKSVRSATAQSVGTSASGMTRASSAVWKEVEQAVQDEVAKIVAPLQEQIQNEAAARQRAEEALKKAGIQAPEELS